jgi:hypothetical protein
MSSLSNDGNRRKVNSFVNLSLLRQHLVDDEFLADSESRITRMGNSSEHSASFRPISFGAI